MHYELGSLTIPQRDEGMDSSRSVSWGLGTGRRRLYFNHGHGQQLAGSQPFGNGQPERLTVPDHLAQH